MRAKAWQASLSRPKLKAHSNSPLLVTEICSANKVNLHAVTANTNVFTSLAGVFGMVPTSAGFTTALFQAYRVSTIKKVRSIWHHGTMHNVACFWARADSTLDPLCPATGGCAATQ